MTPPDVVARYEPEAISEESKALILLGGDKAGSLAQGTAGLGVTQEKPEADSHPDFGAVCCPSHGNTTPGLLSSFSRCNPFIKLFSI